ncbi:MAG: NAD(P)-dependent oxidoreductase [bacterium]
MIKAKKNKKTEKEKIAKKVVNSYRGPECIIITGAAGYIGAMLADQFSCSPDLKEIIAIDRKTIPTLLENNKKVTWIKSELSTGDWRALVADKKPEVVIHCAWETKDIYGEEDLQKKLNIEAAENVFDFAFSCPTVKKIIHISSDMVYGLSEDNNKNKIFVEGDILRESEYTYGSEKKEVENILARKYVESNRTKNVFVIRPSTVFGPRAKYMIEGKGALTTFVNTFSVVPVASEDWGRQYVHEDDLTDIVAILALNKPPLKGYEVFNVAINEPVFGKEIASVLGKEGFYIPPLLIRIAFLIMWHVFQGKMPTGNGVWKSLSYPMFIDGSKVTKVLRYPYNYSAKETLGGKIGRYDYAVPKIEEKKEEPPAVEKTEELEEDKVSGGEEEIFELKTKD